MRPKPRVDPATVIRLTLGEPDQHGLAVAAHRFECAASALRKSRQGRNPDSEEVI